MDKYIEYIEKLKKTEISRSAGSRNNNIDIAEAGRNPNFERLEEKILDRIQKNKISLVPKVALAGSMAVLLIAAGLYFYSNSISQNGSVMAYIMDSDSFSNQDPVLSFIFEE